jgi:formiminoglutamase
MTGATHRPAPTWSGRSDPEDGPLAVRMHHCVRANATRAITGFACDLGVRRNQGRAGAADGPRALRQALANLAAPVDFCFADLGDIAPDTDDLEAAQAAMAAHLAAALATHERVVVSGGGHETAFASFCGLRAAFPQARIGIVNLDAHLDLRAIGPAGATSGTPFAQIRAADPARFDYLCLGLAREANTEALLARARDWGVGMVEDHALIADPLAGHAALDALMARNDLLYLTVCLDVLAHMQAPGVSAPAARGVPLATIEGVIAHALARAKDGSARIALCDIVELAPAHDHAGMTAKTAALIARRMLTQ